MEKVALYKTEKYERAELREKISKMMDEFGGLNALFKSGEKVLVKPNLLFARSYDRHVTTHPDVVYAACSLLKEAGCRVTIGDSPGIGNAVSVANKCGIGDVARELEIPVVTFEASVTIKGETEGRIFRRFDVAREAAESDKILNLAKLKSHGQMLLTMAVKNMFGAVVGLTKPQWHFKTGPDADLFARMLIELNLALKPAFSILDGIIGMEGNGPGNGDPRPLGILLGGTNCVAIDAVAASLIKVAPEQFFTGRAAIKMGLAGARLDGIEIAGDRASDFTIENFRLPHIIEPDWPIFGILKKFLKKMMTPKPDYLKNKCKMCMVCAEICPAKAIEKTDAGLGFDLKKCISCFCCQEMCPHDAIGVRESAGLRILKKMPFFRF